MEVIKIDNVYKSFKIYYDKGSTLKEKILFKNRNKHEIHKVLNGVSLNVEKGEVVGLVGENGSGKSTLLKLMTKIIYPDKGSIEIKGKISSLLELGAGFHPDMTGRENIYTNASIFGLTKKEIDDRIERIIDFSELGDFIDNPVRTYSSGMYMRLAFSVAINVDAEVLLVDEILAVGDASFQAKCFNKMQEIKNDGTTIVIVSHDLNSIEKLCDKAVWIDEGYKKLEGTPHDVIAEYLDKIMNKNVESKLQHETELEEDSEDKENEQKFENRTGNRDVEVRLVKIIECDSNEEKYIFKPEDSVKIIIEYVRKNDELLESVVGFGIMRKDGVNCYGTNTYIDNASKVKLNKSGIIEIFLEKIELLEGEYTLDIAFHDEYGKPYDYIRKIKEFSVYSSIKDSGIFRLKHEFRVK
ncbi:MULTISPECIES: ABC transporter ATP-binding protein [Clostridium]|uniref:Sugar ABC transporter ATP-binding protein n=1 Tax=Clostridium diolis TaxID=223919 RepID=A0AAV3VWX8_9CLOT|nr:MULTISPECIES: ABC transporter ATP-binding protein [Clostridium]MBA8932533.1 ABC-2 type transport system ATP-binding protein [Clostridium beijerinckii]NRT37507.1 ABC-2 type transport system ATP-binding protein [Clostridium beijerinckii]NRT48751.1 ABC-2 type transport system ATP-binding protein [Clostridium beijerinckii]NRU36737.1 ABC-2 type transport system ATP-binding protein [Clostridium beijerinckii]NRZ22953.1 ABC-2 type transport system ATP-binding protein [Clostridium beijerinckii]